MKSTHASGCDARQQFYMVENYFILGATGRERHIRSVIYLLKNSLVVFATFNLRIYFSALRLREV